MKRALVALGVCLAVLLGGVAWITATTLRLEDSAARARDQAAVEETVRLALWRLDSDLAPLLAREASRPAAAYAPGSPLANARFRDVLVYFQVGEDGAATTPQTGAEAASRLAALAPVLDRDALLAALSRPPSRWVTLSDELPRQTKQSGVEYQQREKSIQQAANAATFDADATRSVASEPGGLIPIWRSSRLLLVRRATASGADVVQGLELAWPALRDDLLADVRDILPEAALAPAGDAPAERRLASLPVRLEPGRLATPAPTEGAPTRIVLVGAWAAVLVACGTVAALLLGALALGERRAAFVSAVTHELRTPLTTLRTYTEMLESDMVPPEKRPAYLRTLGREAERLAGLVDNVLSYARLERGRRPPLETTTAAALAERARPRLEERAAAAGVALTITTGEETPVRADAAAVEQILFNLVENACKYGGGAAIRLTADGSTLQVADAGPGVSDADRRWLFEPFGRSAERAAGSAPGVGLGLALCRRLARAMGGELTLAPGPGAVFVLRLRG